MKKIILGLITLGILMSCEKEEVQPIAPDIIPISPIASNHVIITINEVQPMDSIKLIHNDQMTLVRTSYGNREELSCNFFRNASMLVEVVGDCKEYTYEIIGEHPIEIKASESIEYVYL